MRLEGEPPANAAEVMPLLLKLAAQSDAMRSLQSAEGEALSESARLRCCAARWRKDCASWPTWSTTRAPRLIRLRAKGLAGGIEHREMTLEIARGGRRPALEIVCGPLCTWRMKTRGRPALLPRRRARRAAAGAAGRSSTTRSSEALGASKPRSARAEMGVPFKLPMNVTDLLVSAGEAAGHPKHFAYFMPEDEGVDGLPLRGTAHPLHAQRSPRPLLA